MILPAAMHAPGQPGIRIAVLHLQARQRHDHDVPVANGVDCSFPLRPLRGAEQREFDPAAGFQYPEVVLPSPVPVAETREVGRLLAVAELDRDLRDSLGQGLAS